MKREEKIIVGISVGDLNGIGPEIIIKTYEDPRTLELNTPVIFASGKTMQFFKNHFKSIAPKGVKVKVIPHHGGQGYVTPINSIGYQAASKAYEYDKENKAFRVYLHNDRKSWSFVRDDLLPDNLDKYTIQDWEMAYCSKYQYQQTFSCIVQRVYQGIHYQTSIDEENFKNFEKYELLIHKKIEHWKRNCELEKDHAS